VIDMDLLSILRRWRFRQQMALREIERRSGLSRNTIRKYPFEGGGDSVVEKPRYEDGKVWINATQGFAGVSAIAWDFHIGGYQPAQKWLKDRKGRALSYDDIRHY
jgi:transcriptional regulator with XRE-family HTH domain